MAALCDETLRSTEPAPVDAPAPVDEAGARYCEIDVQNFVFNSASVHEHDAQLRVWLQNELLKRGFQWAMALAEAAADLPPGTDGISGEHCDDWAVDRTGWIYRFSEQVGR